MLMTKIRVAVMLIDQDHGGGDVNDQDDYDVDYQDVQELDVNKDCCCKTQGIPFLKHVVSLGEISLMVLIP